MPVFTQPSSLTAVNSVTGEEVVTESIALNKFDDARLKKIHGSIIRNGSAASSLLPAFFKCRAKSANPMNRVFGAFERTTTEQPLPAIISCKTRFPLKASICLWHGSRSNQPYLGGGGAGDEE